MVLVHGIGVRVPARQPTSDDEEVLSAVARSALPYFMYFVYLAKCEDGSIYTGITTDPKRRLKEHQSGVGGAYTRAKKVVKILYTEEFPTRSLASKRESEIKGWSRVKKTALINSLQLV
ncbi:MAG: GIY-YIG nuclease family protein [Patescibacteria group bacterium]